MRCYAPQRVPGPAPHPDDIVAPPDPPDLRTGWIWESSGPASQRGASNERRPSTRLFRALSTLRLLNVGALGLSLGAATATIFSTMFQSGVAGAITGISTAFFGIAWAIVLRLRATVGRTKLRWGWVASVPLAAFNAAVSCAILLASERPSGSDLVARLFGGAALGATFGAIIWVPALVLTLLVFGLPVARAQRLADLGLAGEERGERTVAFASLIVALCAIVGANVLDGGRDAFAGVLISTVLGGLGLVTGGAAAALAVQRQRGRTRFVRAVEEGKVHGYRVDTKDEGKVLVRVSSQGEGYRVRDIEDELVALDEAGEAIAELRPKTQARRA